MGRGPERRTSLSRSSSTSTSRSTWATTRSRRTADYRGITDAVREVIEHGSFDLIETMADAIARRVASAPRVVERDGRGAQAERGRSAGDRRRRRRRDGDRGRRHRRVGRDERRRLPRARFEPRGSAREPPVRGRRPADRTRAPGDGLQPGLGDDTGRRSAAARLPERGHPGRTDLSARDLLDAARRVEARLGRVRKERWGARTIDVDILLYDDEQIDEPDLVVPHPRLAERAFVVLPLLELEPDPSMPDGTRLKEVRIDTSGVVPSASPLAVRP